MSATVPPEEYDQPPSGAGQPSDDETLYPDPETRSLLEKSPEDATLPPELREHLRRLAADLARQAEKERGEAHEGLPDPIARLIGDLPEVASADISQVEAAPKAPAQPKGSKRSASWRVTFQIGEEGGETLIAEVKRPTIIGRSDPRAATHPDLDFSAYGAVELGMSRQHAILLPASDGVWLIDLDSTNGTWVNDHYLHAGLRYRLQEDGLITFGALKVRIHAVERIRAAKRPKRAS